MSELAGSSRPPISRRAPQRPVHRSRARPGTLVIEHDGLELHVAGTQRRRLSRSSEVGAGAATSDAIAEALWGETPPPTATKAIQNHVAPPRRSPRSIGSSRRRLVGIGSL